MYRLQLVILLALLGSAVALAQDAEPESGDDPVEEETPSAADEVTDEEIEELLGIDEDYTEIEDDDFDPTQEVRFEQSINFPTDI